MTATQEQLDDFECDEQRMNRKEQLDKQAEKVIDRQIEMFNDINALFGYTRK